MFETAAQLCARVVEHFVHRAAARLQLAGHSIDLDIVQRDGNEDLALSGRQFLVHGAS
jgi:hypothetical protein